VSSPEESPDRALVFAVIGRIEERMPDPQSLRGLSEVEADLMAAVTAHGVIGNGGHDFWYQGKDREETLRAAEAFERMEAIPVAKAMRQSLEAFPAGTPNGDYFDAHRTELKRIFGPLDRVVWDLDFDAVAARYIRAKTSQLTATDPGLAKAVRGLLAH
jgi:hypothetical protein